MSEHMVAVQNTVLSSLLHVLFKGICIYANKPYIPAAHSSQTIDKRHAVTNHDIDVEPALQGTGKGLEINFEDG